MTITSIRELLPHATALESGETGILALDLDYTLIMPPLIASDSLNFFLEANNALFGHHPTAHYPWLKEVRELVDYRPCESVEVVEEVVDAFRKKGWLVKIFTARSEAMREITFTHIHSAGLRFDREDVIFCGEVDKGVKIEQKAGVTGKLRVVGADDQLGHVLDIKQLAKRVSESVVDFFCYVRHIPSPRFSNEECQELKQELRLRLPEKERKKWENEHVLTDRNLHRLVREVAKGAGLPFAKVELT